MSRLMDFRKEPEILALMETEKELVKERNELEGHLRKMPSFNKSVIPAHILAEQRAALREAIADTLKKLDDVRKLLKPHAKWIRTVLEPRQRLEREQARKIERSRLYDWVGERHGAHLVDPGLAFGVDLEGGEIVAERTFAPRPELERGYSIRGTETGRTSSNGGNLQSLPLDEGRTGYNMGEQVRRMRDAGAFDRFELLWTEGTQPFYDARINHGALPLSVRVSLQELIQVECGTLADHEGARLLQGNVFTLAHYVPHYRQGSMLHLILTGEVRLGTAGTEPDPVEEQPPYSVGEPRPGEAINQPAPFADSYQLSFAPDNDPRPGELRIRRRPTPPEPDSIPSLLSPLTE